MKKVITVTRCDIDGSEGAAAVGFALDGSAYSIDLSRAHEEKLRGALAPFVTRARVMTKGPQSVGGRDRRSAIRVWAASAGYTVGAKGVIAKEIVDAYQAEQRAEQTPSEVKQIRAAKAAVPRAATQAKPAKAVKPAKATTPAPVKPAKRFGKAAAAPALSTAGR